MAESEIFATFFLTILLLFLCLFPIYSTDAGTVTGRVAEPLDTDGDGIPDYWEDLYRLNST